MEQTELIETGNPEQRLKEVLIMRRLYDAAVESAIRLLERNKCSADLLGYIIKGKNLEKTRRNAEKTPSNVEKGKEPK